MMKLFSRLSKRERFIAYFFITVFSLLIFEKMILSPIGDRLEVLEVRLEAQEKKLIRVLSLVKQGNYIISQHQKLTGEIERGLSDEEAMTALRQSIEDFARKTNLQVISLEPLGVRAVNFYEVYAARVSAKASLVRLADFIYQLERSPQFIRVSEFNLIPEKENPLLLRAEMLITKAKFDRLPAGGQ